MDLFELLFIALFILFPVLEGILKRRRSKGPGRMEPGETGPESEVGEDARSAADMVPEDLWELMTGQRRSSSGGEDAPWSEAPGANEPAHADSEDGGVATEAPEDWRSEPWVVDDEAEVREPVSAEYEGPEAYSLETPAPEPRSLERPVPTAEERHRAFHELIDRPKPRRSRKRSPLMRSLRNPDGLRQAVLLKEILGPPKGLE